MSQTREFQSEPMEENDCPFCRASKGTGVCPAESELTEDGFKFGCTLEEGHTGPHVACGIFEHALMVWN